MPIFRIIIVILALLLPAFHSKAQPKVTQTGDSIQVQLDQHSTLTFAVHQGMLLGLQQVTVDGVKMKSDQTVQRPFLAQEFINPGIWSYLKLERIRIEGDQVHLDVTLLGGTERSLFENEFIFKGNKAAVLEKGMTPELTTAKTKADRATTLLNKAVDQDPTLEKLKKRLERSKRNLKSDDGKVPFLTQRRKGSVKKGERRLNDAKKALFSKYVKDDPKLQQAMVDINKWNELLTKAAVEHREIHRDFYAFAHLRLPAESSNISTLKKLIDQHKSKLQPGGTLTWTFAPAERNIAGWSWKGWTSQLSFKLNEGHQVNNIRYVGTWEIGGKAAGLTAVSMRYRGIGLIEQELKARDTDGAVDGMWSTTEMIPHAAGQAALVSPVIVNRNTRDLTDRDYARRHRVGAWISKMARGGGMSFYDFQKSGNSILISYREKQGNYRALTEVLPGDHQLSHTDEIWFANTNQQSTQPVIHLALVTKNDIALNEMRTRWQEVDQYIRDIVSEELDFVQAEPLPGVGFLVEAGRAGFINGLAKKIKPWHDQGVRMLVTHTPGWHSTQHHLGADKPQQGSGNSNAMLDWVPTDDLKQGWKKAQKEMAKVDMPYYVYLTGMARIDGPFAAEVGKEQRFWGMNLPGADFSHGYPPFLNGHNVLNDHARKILLGKLDATHQDYGFQGHWSDSFQNMYMSQLNWGDGSGESMQRKWWEIIAAWSRDGRHWMAESQAFPGMSCSIEVTNWESQPYYFQYTWKWLRGLSIRKYKTEQRMPLVFRFMANKSWVAPHKPNEIPEFKRLSDEYMAALPSMRRSYVLSDGRGILWLPYGSNEAGVVFAYKDFSAPSGVTAKYILNDPNKESIKAYHTYSVTGKNLSQAFGMSQAPLKDPRASKTYQPVDYKFPAWTKE